MDTPVYVAEPQHDFDRAVEEALELADGSEDFAGWWCVATDPWPCPAEECPFVAVFLTAAHRIVVWPALDDRHLLTYADDAKRVGRNPKVREYEQSLGPAIAYDRWLKFGKPIHGARVKPDWWAGHKAERPWL